MFGLRRALLDSFEENVHNLKGNTGAIDLLWKGKLLVEHKSFGESLDKARSQAFEYIGNLASENRWGRGATLRVDVSAIFCSCVARQA